MDSHNEPAVRLLAGETVERIVGEAKEILDSVGVFVEFEEGVDLLAGAGARAGDDGRVRIGPEMVDRALATAPSRTVIYDRNGENPVAVGGGGVHFDPGSAAIKVYDAEKGCVRPSTLEDCIRFARLTDKLPAMALQSTCVVPGDVPLEAADRVRLAVALENSLKAVVTGTFTEDSFAAMHRMLLAVRGSAAALREKPLAVFDCCPSPPLKWSSLTGSALVRCAEAGIPAQLVSMPLAGATGPVTLIGAVTQQAAENLSGVVIHQLAGPGSPIVYGGSPAAFDMRRGTPPMGAVETMMIDMASAQVGRRLGLPTHAYMALSDAKIPDWQAGMETGCGAVLAALAGIDMVSGPGMLDFESCQSLEKLLLDNEACAAALRLEGGIETHERDSALEIISEGIASGGFLDLDHTVKRFRREFHFPGPAIDRSVGDQWAAAGGKSAFDRAREEVERLLAEPGPPPLDGDVLRELRELGGVRS